MIKFIIPIIECQHNRFGRQLFLPLIPGIKFIQRQCCVMIIIQIFHLSFKIADGGHPFIVRKFAFFQGIRYNPVEAENRNFFRVLRIFHNTNRNTNRQTVVRIFRNISFPDFMPRYRTIRSDGGNVLLTALVCNHT